MSGDLGWLSVFPPSLAIVVALTTKRVLPSLLAGVVSAAILLNLHALHIVPAYTIDYLLQVVMQPDNLRLVLFSMLVGGLLKLMRDSRGFDAFALALKRWHKSYGKGTVYGLTWILGALLILETWSNVLINGTTMGNLYDRLGISRARMAYFIHTIGINVVALALVNSWGAFYLALLTAQGVSNPLQFLVHSMPYALYCWISLLVVAFAMGTGFTVGPMRRFDAEARRAMEQRAASGAQTVENGTVAVNQTPRLRHMLIPILCLIGGVFFSLWATGDGDITAGNGSQAILFAVVGTIVVTAIMLRIDNVFDSEEIEEKLITGTADFLHVGVLLVLALALGSLTKDMGTGPFVAQVLQSSLPTFVIPALVFVLGAAMSFATGTSYGTFSIMVPIALPIGIATGISPELLFGACIAGGVFGDNCSPISDTTIVTNVASGVPVIDHVRTQLPFALIAAGFATAGYLLLGIFD